MLVRANSLYFITGFLGHVAVWVLETIQRRARSPRQQQALARRGRAHGGVLRQCPWHTHPSPCPHPTAPCRLMPSAGVRRLERALRLPLQALSPHFCLARGVHAVSLAGGHVRMCRRCRHLGCVPACPVLWRLFARRRLHLAQQ